MGNKSSYQHQQRIRRDIKQFENSNLCTLNIYNGSSKCYCFKGDSGKKDINSL